MRATPVRPYRGAMLARSEAEVHPAHVAVDPELVVLHPLGEETPVGPHQPASPHAVGGALLLLRGVARGDVADVGRSLDLGLLVAHAAVYLRVGPDRRDAHDRQAKGLGLGRAGNQAVSRISGELVLAQVVVAQLEGA